MGTTAVIVSLEDKGSDEWTILHSSHFLILHQYEFQPVLLSPFFMFSAHFRMCAFGYEYSHHGEMHSWAISEAVGCKNSPVT